MMVCLHFLDPAQSLIVFDLKLIVEAFYNLFFAVIGFVWLRQISRSEGF